jgi:hypothetical protein
MLPDGPVKKFASEVAALVHADKKPDAARHIIDFCKLTTKLDGEDPKKVVPVLAEWLHFLLNNSAPEEAAQLLWTPTQFSPEPECTKAVWKLFKDTSLGLIMGAGSMSKSYGMGVRLFLEWIRDPVFTSIRVIGPSKAHLSANLFSHLVSLHSGASIPCPGEVGDLFIGEDRRNLLGSITGVVIPLGSTKKAARLQGAKRKPRPNPHPIFGALSRFFVFVDEFENVPKGLFSDIDNILTQVDSGEYRGFGLYGAYNPQDMSSEVAKRAEPDFGWENLNADLHFRWRSRRGWEILRLDGERSENVIQGKIIYPGLQTRSGLEAIARNAGGRDSAGYLTMGRGLYPIQGTVTTIIPPGMWPKFRGEYIWFSEPVPVAACDLALEGNAAAVYTLGRFGKASGMKLPPDLDNPRGKVVMFKDSHGQVQPRYGLQIDVQHILPRGDTVAIKDRLIELNRKAGVKPEYFSMDRTGNGAGAADLIRHEWGTQIHDVNFSQGPTQAKLMAEDSTNCDEQFDRMNSELWWALRAWGEHGYLMLSPALDMAELTQQVTQRRLHSSGRKARIESKKDYMSRGFTSPDRADSLTLCVHAARMGSGIILSRSGESVGGDGEDSWYDEGVTQIIDCTNRQDHLE